MERLFELQLYIPATCPPTWFQNAAVVDWRCVFGAELVVTEGWMSKGFYPAPIVSVAVLHCWHCVQGLEALLCCVRERLAAAGEGEAGCNP